MLDVFLNYACQAKCPFCFNPPLTPELIRWKLPLELLARELLAQRKRGYQGVTFSGGEVTLLKDLPKIILLARRAGYSEIGIISNGLRLADFSYAQELSWAGLSFCCLSVHGPSAEIHDRLLQVSGAFSKILEAARHLAAMGKPLIFNYVLNRVNFHLVPEFVERFADQPGVVEFQIYYPHYDGLMALNAGNLKISIKEVAPYLEKARQAAQRLGVEEKLWFYNFPPCALAGLLPRLRNWENEEGTSLLVDPQGVSSGAFFVERKDRIKTRECERCNLNTRCLGFEKSYVGIYGTEEFSAL